MIPRPMRCVVAAVITSLTLIAFLGGRFSKSMMMTTAAHVVPTCWIILTSFGFGGSSSSSTSTDACCYCALFSATRRHRRVYHPVLGRTDPAQAFAFFDDSCGTCSSRHSGNQDTHTYRATTSLSSSRTDHQAHDDVVKGITLKIAVDAQGAAADLAAIKKSERFTCAESLDMVHRLRAVSDAVLVGKTTVLVDNPSLTVRRGQCRRSAAGMGIKEQPIRVVLDPTLSLLRNETIRTTFHLFRPGTSDDDGNEEEKAAPAAASPPKTIVFYANDIYAKDDTQQILANLPDHISCLAVPRTSNNDRLLSIPSILDTLARRFHVQHLMVEGGPVTAKQFLPFVDRCLLVRAVTVRFREPLDAGLDTNVLQDAGLQYLGTTVSGADEIDYWSSRRRPGNDNNSKDASSWPTVVLSDWP